MTVALPGYTPPTDAWVQSPYVGRDSTMPNRLVGLGEGLQVVICQESEAKEDFFVPASRQAETVEEEFLRLAAKWQQETEMLSSVTAMAMHPAYQRIIGLGQDALPSILRELARQPNHWYWALKAITGVDPVPPADRGNIKKMAEAWIAWGKNQGHVQ